MQAPPDPVVPDASTLTSRSRTDAATLAAIGCVVIGWFFMDTLTTQLGRFKQTFRFLDMWAIIGDPLRLLTGIDRSLSVAAIAFTLLCIAAAAAPLAATVSAKRAAWLGYLAPLVLMLACFGALYSKTSAHHFSAGDDASVYGKHIFHFAMSVTVRTGEAIAKYISVSAGAYLSLLASGFLAVRGAVKLRKEGPTRP
jgi:hypothetical protein